MNKFEEEGASMKLVTFIHKIVFAKLVPSDTELALSGQIDSMNKAIARANSADITLFKVDYLE